MATLDPLIQEILLKGDDEVLRKFQEIGEHGAESIHKLYEAIERTHDPMQAFVGLLGIAAAALTGATAALIDFVEGQTALSQKAELLAEAFGATSSQLQELEAVFASSGVKVEQFERFANRLTITIAREWPQIAESIRNYANENDAAQLRVQNAVLHLADAQKAVGDNEAARAAQATHNNEAVEASYLKLAFAAQHAAQDRISAANAVSGAQLSETAALQRLATLEGRPPSAAEKQNLELAQAQQAVDNARAATANARTAQQEQAANAQLKQRKLESEYEDLRRKAAQNARDDAENAVKDQNRVREAIIAKGEAEEKANKFALTNVVSIKAALDGIVSGNKEAAHSIDLTQVSVENLTKGLIAQASAGGKAPEGLQALASISKTLSSDTEHLIGRQERLAVVNHLAATSMRSLGVSGAEILYVLENDSDAIQRLTKHADELKATVDPKVIREFNASLASLNLTVSLLSQQFAAAAAPTFTKFLKAVEDSLTKSDGLLRNVGVGIKAVIDFFVALEATTNKAFSLSAGSAFKGLLVTIGVLIIAWGASLIAIPLAIAVIVTALGYVVTNWDKIKAKTLEWYEYIKGFVVDNPVTRFIDKTLDGVERIKNAWKSVFGGEHVQTNSEKNAANADRNAAAAPAQNVAEGTQALATGGPVRGPGSGTSDSIYARLSNGEFVTQAKAVAYWGADFMHAINNMQMPGFAGGGLVPAPVRLGGGSGLSIAPASSTLNLSIDGRMFNGLRGPKSTIDELSNFAVARQTSSAGVKPSWVK